MAQLTKAVLTLRKPQQTSTIVSSIVVIHGRDQHFLEPAWKKRKLTTMREQGQQSQHHAAANCPYGKEQEKPSLWARTRNAWVAVLYGNKPGYSLEAVVLGQSISQSKTVHELVLLHTWDVPPSWLQMLKLVGWQPRLVAYLQCHNFLHRADRFEFVFTKLQILILTDYKRVVLLDQDLLFMQNMTA